MGTVEYKEALYKAKKALQKYYTEKQYALQQNLFFD